MIVWLASYPRSGNTFLRVILNSIFDIKSYSIYNDLKDIDSNEKTKNDVGHQLLPKNFSIEEARKSEQIYFIKTHDKPLNTSDKTIYLVRDGREAVWSYTKYQNKYGTVHKELLDTIYGNTYFGSWDEHLKAWDPRNRPNTLTIKFEELTDDPYAFIEMIAKFIDVTPVRHSIPSFEALQKNNDKFFASGKKDSWKEHFSDGEELLFWLLNSQTMRHFHYTDNIPHTFKALEQNHKEVITLGKDTSDYYRNQLMAYQKLPAENNVLKDTNKTLSHTLETERRKLKQIKQSFLGRILLKILGIT